MQTRPDVAVALDGDPVRLAQVFGNLLNNAAKYTRSRRPDPTWRQSCAPGEVVVSVRDEGIGIEPEMLPHVFEMFSQSSRALGRAQGGLGIGLALVKGLVELHGGRVEASSYGLDRGSCFEVSLPLAPQLAVSSTPAALPQPASCRIMVVDDNHDGADSLALLLGAQGHDVRTVYDGESAVAEAARFHPRVVLLDLGMPGLDGFDTARRLRVVITHGALDAVVRPEVVAQHRAGLPHAQVDIMPEAGHAAFWDDAAQFNRRLGAFREEVANSGASYVMGGGSA